MFKKSLTLFTSATLVSCITVNIYFPAAAAEKAADQIIREVWHKNQPQEKPKLPKENEESLQEYRLPNPRAIAVALFSAISRNAYAGGTDYFKITSPRIEQIKASISRRFYEIRTFFQSGAVGLTGDGYVAVRSAASVPMAKRAAMNRLVNADNADRKALYQAIAAANHHPEWFNDIQKTFAQRWIVQLERGWWYQKSGQWVRK